MTKALLKKQLMEAFSWVFQNKKNGKKRSGINLIAWCVFYVVVFGFLGYIFYMMADEICKPLCMLKMGWLYLALMGIIGALMGIVGSVMNTYSAVYQAKDNDMLLAMPISTGKILMARLSGVYILGVLYELLVMIPVVIVYFKYADIEMTGIIFTLLILVLLSVFILTLSCIVGWFVAQISSRLKNQKIVTVVLVLIFLGGYYFICGKASVLVDDFLKNPFGVIKVVKRIFYPLYQMGRASEGNVKSMVIFTAMVLVSFGVVYFIMSRSFMKLAVADRTEVKRKYVEKKHKVSNAGNALLKKEFRRFLSSSNYMLNCGLGIVFMLAAAVALIVKRELITEMIWSISQGNEQLVWLIATAAICMIMTMNDMTAPSVSLEGKHIWLVQVLPVSGWQVLFAKMKMHLLLTLIPVMILTVCVELILKPSAVFMIIIPVMVILFVVFLSGLGLIANLKFPNLGWTSEIVPIKQGMSVMIALMGSWVIIAALGFLYYAIRNMVNPDVYLVFMIVLFSVTDVLMIRWLKTRGARIFETL